MSEQVKTVIIKPIKESVQDYEGIERALKSLFKRTIYFPLLHELDIKRSVLSNAESESALIEALQSGLIQFNRGTFSGRLNSSISKELRAIGAKWDRSTRTYKMPLRSLPLDVQQAVRAGLERFSAKLARIDQKLAQILPEEIAGSIKINHLFDKTLFKVERNFQKSVRGITIAPKLTERQKKQISDEYTLNLNKWINDFLPEHIVALRDDVKRSVLAGNRDESLRAILVKNYGVAENKAKFLARQETNLFMAKFKEARYKEIGSKEYTWGCVAGSPAHPVRKSHRALEGKTFFWDNPPITSEPGEPVRHNNPGEDYNCRCFARPLVRFKKGN